MAEGNRKITLYEPGESAGVNEFGQEQRDVATPHVVWATRRDRGGRQRLEQDIELATWTTSFRFRWSRKLAAMTSRWWIVDDAGRGWRIESVQEFDRRQITLYCEALV